MSRDSMRKRILNQRNNYDPTFLSLKHLDDALEDFITKGIQPVFEFEKYGKTRAVIKFCKEKIREIEKFPYYYYDGMREKVYEFYRNALFAARLTKQKLREERKKTKKRRQRRRNES